MDREFKIDEKTQKALKRYFLNKIFYNDQIVHFEIIHNNKILIGLKKINTKDPWRLGNMIYTVFIKKIVVNYFNLDCLYSVYYIN